MKEIAATKKSYNLTAHLWSEKSSNSFFHEKQFRLLIKHLKNGGRVIDIGCANGICVPLFLGIGSKLKYEGYDFSKSMLKIAKARYPNLSFGYFDISDSKTLPKKKYDAAWAAAVLMHVPFKSWDKTFDNLETLIKPKGYMYITLPENRPTKYSERDQRHFTLIKKADFIKYVKARGWKVIKAGRFLGSNDNPWNWFIVQLP